MAPNIHKKPIVLTSSGIIEGAAVGTAKLASSTPASPTTTSTTDIFSAEHIEANLLKDSLRFAELEQDKDDPEEQVQHKNDAYWEGKVWPKSLPLHVRNQHANYEEEDIVIMNPKSAELGFWGKPPLTHDDGSKEDNENTDNIERHYWMNWNEVDYTEERQEPINYSTYFWHWRHRK